jgi:hypothetical protein
MPGYNSQRRGTTRTLPKFLCFSCLFCVALLLIMFFCVLFVCKCVLYYCHRVSTEFQLTNISYHISYMSYHIYHIIYIIYYILYITYHIVYYISNISYMSYCIVSYRIKNLQNFPFCCSHHFLKSK